MIQLKIFKSTKLIIGKKQETERDRQTEKERYRERFKESVRKQDNIIPLLYALQTQLPKE